MEENKKEVMLGVPDDGVYLTEHRAMVCLPEDAVEVDITAKVFADGKLIDVSKKLSMKELREAFRKADEGYIDDDDVFRITEKGEQFLRNLKDFE